MHGKKPEFHRKIIMSDEAHFYLGGYVDKQNCRIWGSENPKLIIEKPLYPQRVTVWSGFWSGGIIGPYFFESEAGAAVSRMDCTIEPCLMNFYGQNWKIWMWTMFISNKTAPTCHTSGKTIGLLRDNFQVEWFLETAITIGRRDHAI